MTKFVNHNFSMLKKLCFFTTVLLVLSCKKERESDEYIQAIQNIENKLLTISTYEGSGQVVHPDVLWDEGKKQFWLAITPYPDYQDQFENPCLYHSVDGMNFSDSGISNPLAPAPVQGFNCDPDVFLDRDGSKKMIYVETRTPDFQIIHILSFHPISIQSFTKDTLLIHEFDATDPKTEFILSPSVVVEPLNYHIYYVNLLRPAAEPNEIKMAASRQLNNLQVQDFVKLNVPMPENYNPWHLDVFKTSGKYVMLLNGFYGGKYDNNGGSLTGEYSIQLLTSSNGIDWKNHGDIIGKGNPEAEAIIPDPHFRYVYRSSGLYSQKLKKLVVWYSYVTTANVWKMGVHKFDLDLEKM